jgi:capsular polysaccharide biosynthesis protein
MTQPCQVVIDVMMMFCFVQKVLQALYVDLVMWVTSSEVKSSSVGPVMMRRHLVSLLLGLQGAS